MTPSATPAPVASSSGTKPNYMISQLDEVPPVRCPCGFSSRSFATPDNQVATVHVVDIQLDAQTHYHKKMTEIYTVLEVQGEGFIELDGERFPVKPLTSIFIKPGCRHRAIGRMKILNIPIPAFDPHDEWFD
jgi:mannose-6-phosphate isomerase-like protein (cupin superfamily)